MLQVPECVGSRGRGLQFVVVEAVYGLFPFAAEVFSHTPMQSKVFSSSFPTSQYLCQYFQGKESSV